MNIEIELKPNLVIESFNTINGKKDYSTLRRFKLVYKEGKLEENVYGELEPVWMVESRNLTMWLGESEIKEHYWLKGSNNNLNYSSFKIIEEE